MSDATLMLEVRCGRCNRFMGQQQVFPWLAPLPPFISDTCAPCAALEAQETDEHDEKGDAR